jgi:hypothetical protein
MAIGSEEGTSLQETTIHDVLRNDRRRRVLKLLQREKREVRLRELSERVASLETGESPPPKNIRESVYVSLHQTHLPKLNDLDIVDYDRDRKTISLNAPAKEVDLYMEVVTAYGVTWASFYRWLGIVGLCSVVLSVAEVPGVRLVEPVLWASVFLVLFAVAVAYQFWTRRWLYLTRMD